MRQFSQALEIVHEFIVEDVSVAAMGSSSIPILRYAEAERAITWLCQAFGFAVFLKVPGPDGRITHARLTLEDNMVMLASLGRDGDFDARFRSPADAGGVTQSVLLTVRDPDATYASARAAGARIIGELEDFAFGGRMFSCEDPEGHQWVFSSHDHWKKLW